MPEERIYMTVLNRIWLFTGSQAIYIKNLFCLFHFSLIIYQLLKTKHNEHLGLLSVGYLFCSCYNAHFPGSATLLSYEIPGKMICSLNFACLM